ncbi:hypothetical protein C1922_06145 [Stenotrophomonas sp. ZAC14D2_NAIMI4_7]|uniref:Imm8 family immunity protein n=1 Tax=Stenotrophomonas sp. ZAC14D2_NAIMI4_7 TaxID=2072405 RepID=UPI000D53C9F5|nr:Imm8 family immunity protein [Stenotrophomonas sp. ZAC14D2_NAIMI4_7]AWH16928.1 hypothetical protein C1922_06145 [Stenotrophomonas sp. ZAC14D2_NAIMI4_7]
MQREWLERMEDEGKSIPKLVIVDDVSFEAVERAVLRVCATVPDGTWAEMASKLAEMMDWEFEGYVPLIGEE